MLWPAVVLEMEMPDYDKIKKELVEYIKTCKVNQQRNVKLLIHFFLYLRFSIDLVTYLAYK